MACDAGWSRAVGEEAIDPPTRWAPKQPLRGGPSARGEGGGPWPAKKGEWAFGPLGTGRAFGPQGRGGGPSARGEGGGPWPAKKGSGPLARGGGSGVRPAGERGRPFVPRREGRPFSQWGRGSRPLAPGEGVRGRAFGTRGRGSGPSAHGEGVWDGVGDGPSACGQRGPLIRGASPCRLPLLWPPTCLLCRVFRSVFSQAQLLRTAFHQRGWHRGGGAIEHCPFDSEHAECHMSVYTTISKGFVDRFTATKFVSITPRPLITATINIISERSAAAALSGYGVTVSLSLCLRTV